MYDYSLIIREPRWDNLVALPKGTVLIKGLHGPNRQIMDALAGVPNRFRCYTWATQEAQEEVFYCGSFTQDYASGISKNNIQERVRNYLQNHRISATGHKNTNLMVFENINAVLQTRGVDLRLLRFRSVRIGGREIDFASYSSDPDLIRAVEQLIIAIYKEHGQCSWNRV